MPGERYKPNGCMSYHVKLRRAAVTPELSEDDDESDDVGAA